MKEEIFKEFTPGYSVSNYGRVRNDIKNTIRVPQKRPRLKNGKYYCSVLIKNKNYSIHRLVALYFVINNNPSEYDTVNHIDNNPSNNHYTNLEWTNDKGNHRHSLNTGTHTSLWLEDYKKQQNEYGKPTKTPRPSKSGYKGITLKKSSDGTLKYIVHFNNREKARYIGTFYSLEEAKKIYRDLYFELYGIEPYDV